MGKQHFNIGTGLFDKSTMTFQMGKDKIYTVKTKEEKVKYKEREDAGGGCYWANSWVWTEKIRVIHSVWDGDKFIGTVIPGSSVKFKDPNRHQIKMFLNQTT